MLSFNLNSLFGTRAPAPTADNVSGGNPRWPPFRSRCSRYKSVNKSVKPIYTHRPKGGGA